MMRHLGRYVVMSIAALALAACGGTPEPAPTVSPGSLSVPINVAPKHRVDVLFLVDDSNSMDSMQEFLRQSFYEFFRPFDDLAARGTFLDFHIGVVTSDLGAGRTGAPGCTPGGLGGGGAQGRLIGLGKKAQPDCLAPNRVPFIEVRYLADGRVESNLPDGQGLAETFTCMAAVGSNGCGFEHQLEAVRRALSGEVPDNRGFLRDDAALAVVFLTNEDDASAPPDSDVYDKNKVAEFGIESSYARQTRFAVVCGNPGRFPPYDSSVGPIAGCRPAPNPRGAGPGQQYDVQRYIDFFTLPKAQGGVKADPADVILYAIDGPETPFEVVLSNPATPAGVPFQTCAGIHEASNPPCVPVLQHSCMNPRNPNLFGDPAVRINTVVRAVGNHRIWSICDEDYPMALRQFGSLTAQAATGAGCIPDALVGADARVACEVSDVSDDVDHELVRNLPRCENGGPRPCWFLEAKPLCEGRSLAGWGLSIDRDGEQPPAATHLRARCQPAP